MKSTSLKGEKTTSPILFYALHIADRKYSDCAYFGQLKRLICSQEKNFLHFFFPGKISGVGFCLKKSNYSGGQSSSQVATIINLLLTEHEGHAGGYRPEVMVIWTKHTKVCLKSTKGQYSPVQLKLSRLVSSLLYGTRLKFNSF